MKRTTIMVDENLLYDLQQVARQQQRSTSSIIREALATYVTEQHRLQPADNPLLALAGVGSSKTMTDVSDGGDEQMLQEGVESITAWSQPDGNAG